MKPQFQDGGHDVISRRKLLRLSSTYAAASASSWRSITLLYLFFFRSMVVMGDAYDGLGYVVWVVQWLGIGLVIERSLVRLPAGALSSQLVQLSLPSLRGR